MLYASHRLDLFLTIFRISRLQQIYSTKDGQAPQVGQAPFLRDTIYERRRVQLLPVTVQILLKPGNSWGAVIRGTNGRGSHSIREQLPLFSSRHQFGDHAREAQKLSLTRIPILENRAHKYTFYIYTGK